MSRGFTLVEVLTIMAVGTVVAVLLVSILVNNTGLFYQQSSRVSQGLGLNDSMENIREVIKGAQSVASGFPEAPPQSYTSSATTLVLKLPSIDASGFVLTDFFDYAVYTKETDKLRYQLLPNSQSSRKSADLILTNNVDSILFQYFASNGQEVLPTAAVKVSLSLTLKQKAGASFEVSTATTEANLRND
ncbi:hypothetical protein HY387_00855 [Candidatus Daviesbacteria bacterium]|nr:hypothetical protein [Candidatus Daviesbacteria bacterium]